MLQKTIREIKTNENYIEMTNESLRNYKSHFLEWWLHNLKYAIAASV